MHTRPPIWQEYFGKSGPPCVHQPGSQVALSLRSTCRHDSLSRPNSPRSLHLLSNLWHQWTHHVPHPEWAPPASGIDGTWLGYARNLGARADDHLGHDRGTNFVKGGPELSRTSRLLLLLCITSRGPGWMILTWPSYRVVAEVPVALTMLLNTAPVVCPRHRDLVSSKGPPQKGCPPPIPSAKMRQDVR